MAKKRLIDAVRGRRTDMPPWFPLAGAHCAFLIHETADRMLQNPELLARGVSHAAELYRADGIPLVFDLTVEAHALGCQLEWWPDNVPTVVSHPCFEKTPAQLHLEIPTSDAGRWPVLFEAARKAKPALDALDCCMAGVLCGPMTLASHLAGIRIFTDVYKNKSFAHEVFAFSGRVAAAAAEFYAKMGCEPIVIADPVASHLKSDVFNEFVGRHVQPAVQAIHEKNLTSFFHICGDSTQILTDMCQVGCHGIGVDEMVNLNFVRDTARRFDIGFAGNLKLALALSLGLLSPREDAIACLAAGGCIGYTFAPGCDLPYDVPVEHIEQVLDARDWFYRYYTAYPLSPSIRAVSRLE